MLLSGSLINFKLVPNVFIGNTGKQRSALPFASRPFINSQPRSWELEKQLNKQPKSIERERNGGL